MLRAWGNRVDGIFGQRRSVARSGSVRSALNHIGSGPRTKDYFLGAPDYRCVEERLWRNSPPVQRVFHFDSAAHLDA